MDSLPAELLEFILLSRVLDCRSEKNNILPLRLVCKAFDSALKPYIFKTLQLEFSKFLKSRRDRSYLQNSQYIAKYCQAIYLDSMVIRDEEEITRLTEVFGGINATVPELEPLLESLRQFSMNSDTFDENDFRRVMETILRAAPNLTRMKINLPFQIVGRGSTTATLLLATTLACVAQRTARLPPIEQNSAEGSSTENTIYKPLEVLVLDHVSDTTITDICRNHIDVQNTVEVFSGLKNLVMSIKRQEPRPSRQGTFTRQLWFLITKATRLEGLCLVGWNTKRDVETRIHRHAVVFNEWTMKSLPYVTDLAYPSHGLDINLKHLRYLELKRLDISAKALVGLIQDHAASLEEVYLSEVYLKVNGALEGEASSLWIGLPNGILPEHSIWVAESLRKMKDLNLRILRATSLGYDDFDPNSDLARASYDLTDPLGIDRSFDQRFVNKVTGNGLSEMSNVSEIVLIPLSQGMLTKTTDEYHEFDTKAYHTIYPNTTSQFKRSIDGCFMNHNDQALQELHRMIEVADKGMRLITDEIVRRREATTLVTP